MQLKNIIFIFLLNIFVSSTYAMSREEKLELIMNSYAPENYKKSVQNYYESFVRNNYNFIDEFLDNTLTQITIIANLPDGIVQNNDELFINNVFDAANYFNAFNSDSIKNGKYHT